MTQKIVVIEQARDWKPEFPAARLVLLDDYLTEPQWFRARAVQVINLCRSYKYLSTGYYCSLLAEARGHRVVPSVRTILDLGRRFSSDLAARALEQALNRPKARQGPPASELAQEVAILFGRCDIPQLESFARKLFENFPCPRMRVRLEPTAGGRRIASIRMPW